MRSSDVMPFISRYFYDENDAENFAWQLRVAVHSFAEEVRY